MRALALLVLLCLAWPASAEVLTPQGASARAAAGALTIVDVRLPEEWAATGLPAGALGIPLQDEKTYEVRPGFVEDVRRALGERQDQPVALICAGGVRSAAASALLALAGFTRVYDISEGMTGGAAGPGWLERHLPTDPCKTC